MALQKAVRMGNSTGFKFQNRGDNLKGYYLGTNPVQINGKEVDQHSFSTKDGVLTVLGQADIKKQLKDNSVQAGTWVEITFSGEMQKLKGGRTMKLYDVAFDRDNTMDSSTNDEVDYEDVEAEEEYEEPAPARPTSPKVAAVPPSADRQARMQAMLNKNKSSA